MMLTDDDLQCCTSVSRFASHFYNPDFRTHNVIFRLIVFASRPIPFSIDLLRSSVSLGPPASPVAG
jgi:hypothetical protein